MYFLLRVKAAQKHQLNESHLGITALNRVTVEDVRNIWIHRIIADTGLPSYKVDITREIVDSMEDSLNKKLKKDENGCIQFEHFLPAMVFLIRLLLCPKSPFLSFKFKRKDHWLVTSVLYF